MFTVFVPIHVNRRCIYPCFIDNETQFVDVDSEQQAVRHQSSSNKPFIVFARDFFTVYNVPGGPSKCDYISRNYISLAIYFGFVDKFRWANLSQRNGLLYYPEPPVIYFAHIDSVGELNVGLLNDNTIVFRYRNRDLLRFAKTTRAAKGCCNNYFILYEEGVYQCFNVGKADDGCSPMPTPRCSPIIGHRIDFAASNTLDEKESGRSEDCQPPTRLLDNEFMLMDMNANEVHDGDKFVLVVSNRGDYDDDSDDSDDSDSDDGDSQHFKGDTAGIHVVDRTLMARPGTGNIFTSETVQGIVYLKYNGQYLCCPEDDAYAICFVPHLPQRTERLQINYDRGDIILTKWDGSLYVTCDWASESVGFIGLDGEGHRWCSKDALRIHIAKV